MAGEHILVVDRDATYLRLISSALRTEGYRVTCGATGEEALSQLTKQVPDLVLLEILLPGIDGLEVCRRAREMTTVPIIILTSREAEEDKVEGLLLGADDYVTKPFSVHELLARIRAVLRRASLAEVPTGQTTFEVGDIHIDSLRRRVTRRGEEVTLSPTEFRLLCHLAASPGVVFAHDQLLEKIWGLSHRGEREILRATFWRLRQKVEDDPSHPMRIVTCPGVGYKLAGPE